MESLSLPRPSTLFSSPLNYYHHPRRNLLHRQPTPSSGAHPTSLVAAAVKTPRGFGPKPKSTEKRNTKYDGNDEDDDDDDSEGDSGDDEETIPEAVTNRMMRRVGVTVGTPLVVGLLFFPFFYYLKVGLKIDVPTWIPFIVSFVFFGTALLGVSYGIVSASWDPMREGSLLGWKEARKNWPVFWESFRGRRDGAADSGRRRR